MSETTPANNDECPVARALAVIGDRWTLMILRDAFDGSRRFSEWQKSLGVAKNILAARLKTLVETGLLEISPASDGSAYNEYVLTEQGRAVFPIVVSLRQWGERFLFAPGEKYSVLVDRQGQRPVTVMEVRAESGEVLGAGDCERVVLKKRKKSG